MKAKEVRIGNLLKKDGVVVTIDGRSIFDMWCAKFYAENYDPIPITEEWLLRFGFKNSESINKSNSFFYKPVGGSELHINPDNGVVWIERYTNIFNNPALIEYVHQLQNLYFALTGKELQLTTQQQPDNTTPDS